MLFSGFTNTGMLFGGGPLAETIENVSSMSTSMFGVSMSPTLRGDAWAIAAARGNYSNSVEVLFLHNVFSGFLRTECVGSKPVDYRLSGNRGSVPKI